MDRCPHCGGQELHWGWSPHNVSGATDGRLCTRDVVSLFYLGCDSCSATLTTMHPDKVAEDLNMRLNDV